jgi:hypothetical protein
VRETRGDGEECRASSSVSPQLSSAMTKGRQQGPQGKDRAQGTARSAPHDMRGQATSFLSSKHSDWFIPLFPPHPDPPLSAVPGAGTLLLYVPTLCSA